VYGRAALGRVPDGLVVGVPLVDDGQLSVGE